MRNIYLVIKNEIRSVLGKRSFWIMTLIFPLIILALNLGSQLFIGREIEAAAAIAPTAEQAPQLGYVDEAGVIANLPPDVSPEVLRAYADETAAQAAIAAGELDRYLLIPADYPESGELVVVDPEASIMTLDAQPLFRYVLTYNLVGDAELAAAVIDPLAQTQAQNVAPVAEAGDGGRPAAAAGPLAAAVPFVTLFIFFFLIVGSSGYMLRSVSREKENRTMEVLLVSVPPRQLMAGKVLGLGVVALLQMAIWFGGAALVLSGRFDVLGIAQSVALPDGFLLWAIFYFLAGYFLYASLMGIVGALAPDAREAGQFTFVVLLPLLIPLWLNSALMAAPNGTLAVVLSLIPLTAPVAMMTRLASTAVPLWQIIVGLAGLAITAYLCVLLAARFFRADTLLSFAPLRWQRFLREWRSA